MDRQQFSTLCIKPGNRKIVSLSSKGNKIHLPAPLKDHGLRVTSCLLTFFAHILDRAKPAVFLFPVVLSIGIGQQRL